jgi:PAS domain S-box-containing protein
MSQGAWLALGVAALALLVLVTTLVLRSERRSFVTSQRMYVMLIVTDVLSDLDDVEAEEHEYLLTGQPTYREAYNRSRVILDQEIDRLQRFAKNNPEEQQEIDKLRHLVHQELMQLQSIIEVRATAGFEAAHVLPLIGRSAQQMYAIHQHIKRISDMEQSTLARLSREWQLKRRASLAALVGSILLSACCLFVGSVWLARGELQRQRSLEALHASEKRFETLCQQAPLGIYETDAQGLCIYTNPRWSEVSGRNAAESLGHGWANAVHPDDRARVFEGWKTAAHQGAPWEYRLITPQGEVRWIRGLGGPIYSNGDLTGYVGTVEDVTERKKAEDDLQEALQQLQLITDNLPSGVARCSRDLRYVWVSPSYAAWLGRPRDEVAGQAIRDVLGQEGYTVIGPYLDKVLSGERTEYEARVSYHGIGPRWVHAVYVPTKGDDQKVDGWIGVVADITDRHEVQERLRQSEERFRLIFFQAAVGIAQTGIEGQWQLVNDRLCEMFGYSREELSGKTFVDMTHPDDRDVTLEGIRKLLAGEVTSWSTQKRYFRKDGRTIWARVFVSLVRNPHDEPQYFISVVEDITKAILAGRALEESRRQLRALAGRLINAEEQERKRLSRELHDDLSQKLALLAFDTDSLVLTPPSSVDEIKEPLRGLRKRIVELSNDVRHISHQLHPTVLEDLGLAAALRELCEEFSAREGIEVVFEQETVPQALPVEIASCLYRIAQEALHNVMKHAQASQVRLGVSGGVEGIQFYIHDNGVGFDTKATLPRRGLGIVSMTERVLLVGGEFSIHSQPGQGTEVRVFVPRPTEMERTSPTNLPDT